MKNEQVVKMIWLRRLFRWVVMPLGITVAVFGLLIYLWSNHGFFQFDYEFVSADYFFFENAEFKDLVRHREIAVAFPNHEIPIMKEYYKTPFIGDYFGKRSQDEIVMGKGMVFGMRRKARTPFLLPTGDKSNFTYITIQLPDSAQANTNIRMGLSTDQALAIYAAGSLHSVGTACFGYATEGSFFFERLSDDETSVEMTMKLFPLSMTTPNKATLCKPVNFTISEVFEIRIIE